MNRSVNPLILLGLAVFLVLVYLNERRVDDDADFSSLETPKAQTHSTLLWIAEVRSDEIVFTSNDHVFFTLPFRPTERHLESRSFQLITSYVNPVLVTKWQLGGLHRLLIVDPLNEQTLVEQISEHPIDFSVTDDNRISVNTLVEQPTDQNQALLVEESLVWPEKGKDRILDWLAH